ncbi:MAG: peroxiredoxin [Sphingomonas sp. 28-62-20]|uniref:peroxiredoxin n=1 Tax=Sphingomonas sp. 28-62-20 TaxID=1970433 RepID=UPI000BDB2FE3|nr:MAG: peroxiredoxin [Sphingomonas sp. 28-62-20]
MRLPPLPALIATVALLAAAPASATLAPGAKAPDFTTRGATAGKIFTLHLGDQLKKGPVVLYFFPAAFTPGCSAEARAFAEAVPEFRKAGATVIGMSADPVDILSDFSKKDCAGKFPVASAGPTVVSGYDVALGRTIPGKDGQPRAITSRTSYVITQKGVVYYTHSDMNPADHVKNTLAAVRRLQAERP